MKTALTVVNKSTHASSTVSGLHATLTEPSVVELSVNSVKDIASLQRQGDALVISLGSGEVITVDDFYLLHKGVKNTLVIQDAQGELLTPAMDAAGQPVLDTSSFVKIESIQPLLDSSNPEFNGWWLAGAGLLAGGVALASSGGGGGGGGHSAPAASADQTPTAKAAISAISSDSDVVGDFITNDSTLVVTTALSGPLATGEKVQISLDGGATWHDAQSMGGNLYAYDNSTNVLADGTYVFQARVISAAGTAGAVSTQVVVIDTVAPVVAQTINIAGISNDTGISASDFITSDNTVVINGQLGTTLAAGERVEISLDGGLTWRAASVSGTTWSFDNTANLLTDGNYQLVVRVIDLAGNVGQSAEQLLQIDTTTQHAIIRFTSISPDTGISSVDYVTNGTKITFFGNLTAPLGAGERVEISLDVGVTWHEATVTGTNWEYDPLLDGTYHVMVQVIDAAGNIGSSASIDLVVDTSDPIISSGSTVVANPNGTLSVSGPAGTAEPGSMVSVVFPDGTHGTTLVASDGSYGPITSGTPQSSGTTQITLTDVAGNLSTPATLPFTDTFAPATPAAPVVVQNLNDTLSVSGAAGAAEPGTVLLVTFPDGSSATATVASDGSYGPVTSVAAQPSGTVLAVATDAAGNSSAQASTAYTYVDITPPATPANPVVAANPRRYIECFRSRRRGGARQCGPCDLSRWYVGH